MTTDVTYWLGVAYIPLFGLSVMAFGILRARRRKERPPIPFKHLRRAGETLQNRLKKADDTDCLAIVGAAFLPLP